MVSKLLEFSEMQGVSISSDDRLVLDQLQTNLKDKERITTLVLPKANELLALLDRLVTSMPVER